jgi:hypothetical protein
VHGNKSKPYPILILHKIGIGAVALSLAKQASTSSRSQSCRGVVTRESDEHTVKKAATGFWRPSFLALLRADMCKGVAPLPLFADWPSGTSSRTAETSRVRLLALGAGRHHGLVRMGRVSQSNRHGDCKQRYSKSLQHSFFLPWFAQRLRRPIVCNNNHFPHDAKIASLI